MPSPKIIEELRPQFKGELETDEQLRSHYSHDASIFELVPQVVAFPKDVDDICALVHYVSEQKAQDSALSLTPRSGGTDMSGGAINDSVLVAFERYFTAVGAVDGVQVSAQPGVYYRDFEKLTLSHGLILPSYPASKDLCMLGGMLANNAGGEKSLVYGKTDRYVTQLKMVLRDGREHTFRPLQGSELDEKLKEKSLEGDIFRGLHRLVTSHQKLLTRAKPAVSKNSTGYNLWDLWDGKTFDITKLIVGSQGTLGIITEATFRLVPAKPLSGMVVAFLPSLHGLGRIINALLPLQPTSMESFDEHTLRFAFRFFLSFRKTLGWKRFVLLGLSFIPVLNKLLRYFPHLPKIILLVEFEGENQTEIDAKLTSVQRRLAELGIETQQAKDKRHEEKFWIMRRESFNLLRKNVKRRHTAPFIDDLIVPPLSLQQFLPELIAILDRYELLYTIAGHMGDGNFHIIPLMDLTSPAERQKIYPVLRDVTSLVLSYHGSLSGEHNDGLIRGPMLESMYGPEMTELFRQVKRLFDPANMFNPHKKTDASLDFSQQHIRGGFS